MAYDLAFREYKPKELGIIRLEKVKCGKSNCRCTRGKGHKAYYLYYRDYDKRFERKLKKMYIPKSEVRKWRRKIQLMKNTDNLSRLLNNGNQELTIRVWDEIRNLPTSKMIEKLHTVVKKVKKELWGTNEFLLDV